MPKDSIELLNFIDGRWTPSDSPEAVSVTDPGKGTVLASTPLSTPEEVDRAVRAAGRAFQSWRHIPAPDRIQYLFRLKDLLEDGFEELARTITQENGKTLSDPKVSCAGPLKTWKSRAASPR